MSEDEIPVSGIVMMIKNEDGSFSPIGFTDKNVKNLLNEFLMGASKKVPMVRSNDKYIRKEVNDGLGSSR